MSRGDSETQQWKCENSVVCVNERKLWTFRIEKNINKNKWNKIKWNIPEICDALSTKFLFILFYFSCAQREKISINY